MDTQLEKLVDENQEIAEEEGFLRKFLFVVKKHIIIILVLILLSLAGGYVYSKLKKPYYTSTQDVFFTALNLSAQSESDSTKAITSSINTMQAYFSTVKDFADEQVVVDRANFYYMNYSNAKEFGSITVGGETYSKERITVDRYIDYLNGVGNDKYDSNNIPSDIISHPEILASNIGVWGTADTTKTEWVFSISYTDGDEQGSVDKNRFLVYAFSKEVNAVSPNGSYKYFGDMKINITGDSVSRASSTTNLKKILAISFVIGIILSAIVVFIITKLDNTIKSRDELTRLTGVNVLSCLDSEEVKKNGDK